MSLPLLTEDLSIIAALDDEPNLSASALKAKFDEAGNYIKTYLNDTLIPAIENEIAVSVSEAINELVE